MLETCLGGFYQSLLETALRTLVRAVVQLTFDVTRRADSTVLANQVENQIYSINQHIMPQIGTGYVRCG